MRIAIVGTDDSDMMDRAWDYIEEMPEHIERVYVVDRGMFSDDIQLAMAETRPEIPVVIMKADTAWHGVAATLRRNVELAKEVDKVVAFWDYHEPEVSSIITVAKLYGKKIHVNPHDNGGIVSPACDRPASPTAEAADSNPASEGSNPSPGTNGDVRRDA